MLHPYSDALRRADRQTATSAVRYFVERGMLPGDVPGHTFYEALELARLCQADVVLCLLRLNTRPSLRLAERLVGRPITRCPPCLALLKCPLPPARRAAPPTRDERIVVRTVPPAVVMEKTGKRRLLSTPIYQRIQVIQVGMTVQQLLARGLSRKDIRIATKRGYAVLGERRT